LFFKTIQGSKLITEQIDRSRPEHKLPNVLSKEDVASILQASQNLKPENVDAKRHLLIIVNAKGKRETHPHIG